MTVLDVKSISVFYDDIQALWDVSFSVEKGQLVSVLGANGAGKTTTLKAIAGILKPSSGDITFKNSKVSGLASYEIADCGISLVPEGRQLFSQLDVEDNLRMGSYLKRARQFKEKNLEYVFSLFPILLDRKRQKAETLSGGEQQMLAIGRAIMQEPDLIMLDEPSLGLAPILAQEVFRIINKLKKEGRTILLVEQNVRQALKVADYGYVLENGRITHQGTGAELRENPKIKEAYLGI